MATPATVNPFNFYPGRDGLPLQNGYLYFGEPFQDPELQPLQAYWDDANTQPAARPIRTINGYPARNGAPAQVFVGAQYSMRVRDSQGREVFYAPNVTAVDLGGGGLDIITASGGQTVVTLTNAVYTPGSNAIDIALNGIIQISGQDYFETGTDRITMASALSAGDQIRAFARSTFGLTQAVLSDWQAEVFNGAGGASQNFVLTRNPGAVANLDVSVTTAGVGSTLRPLIDYTLSGNTVTITPAPAVGTNNVLIRYGRSLPQDALRGELASTASAADNAGLVGFNGALDYSAQGDDTVGGLLYSVFGRTAGEIAAGVTPVNYAYPPGHAERYAHNTTPGTTDMTAGINAAYASTGGGGGATIYFEAKQYNHAGLTFDGALNLTMVGKTANNIGNSQAGSFAKSTVLFYTGSSGVGVTFTGSTYTSSGLVFKRIVFYAASSTYCITFNNCAQIEFKKCMVLNNGSSSTAHGVRFSACYYVWFYDSFIAKGDNVRTGTSTGVTIDMGARSSWLGGALNFINTSTQSWASGMIVGDSNPSSANENYATINYIGGEFLSNQVGVQLQHGVKAANFAGTYFEANLNTGAFVTLGAQGVKFDTCFWNNYSASDADIRFGIGGGNTQYQEFYNCAVKNNTFISVNAKGVVVSGVGSSFVDVENNTFTLATVGAVGINSNGKWCRQSDNTFIGFAPGNLATGTFAPSISTTGGSFTATATGFSGSVTGTAYYEKHGNIGHVYCPGLSGTSNATAFTITGLPSDMIPTRTQSAIPVYVVDNSGSPSAVGQMQLDSSGVFTVYPSVAFGTWTASGTKTCGSFNYTYLLT